MNWAMQGKRLKQHLTKKHFLEHAVGECPEVDIQIGGVPFHCFLETGSNISTLTESFFRVNLHGLDNDMHCTDKWLKIAGNTLPLRYLGYIELDIQVMWLPIPECGFIIISDDDNK